MSKQVLDLTAKIGYLKVRSSGFNAIFSPEELKEWTQVTLRTDTSNTVVASGSGEANSGLGISIPVENQLTLLLGPGSTLYAGGSDNANVSWCAQSVPYLRSLQYLEHLSGLSRKFVDLLDKITLLATDLYSRRR